MNEINKQQIFQILKIFFLFNKTEITFALGMHSVWQNLSRKMMIFFSFKI